MSNQSCPCCDRLLLLRPDGTIPSHTCCCAGIGLPPKKIEAKKDVNEPRFDVVTT